MNRIIMNDKERNPRLIAFYLPQFHPTPENNEWWGKGFSEWVNVGKAKKCFPGHNQPKLPGELGYYDLRIPDVREQQAALAKEAGIEGFCYWHYWFAGKRLLEKPFQEVLLSGKPDFPFCLCWANHSWYAKNWNKDVPDKLLIEQTYPGEEDFINHFNAMLPAFKDKRYIRVEGKPLFGIYAPNDLENSSLFMECWNQLARENGFDGFYFVAISYNKQQLKQVQSQGYNAVIYDLAFIRRSLKRFLFHYMHNIFKIPKIVDYRDYSRTLLKNMLVQPDVLPCVIPNFDHTPRSGWRGVVMIRTTPENWYKLLVPLFKMLSRKPKEENLVFIKSWNEWGEGNYLEPDLKYGKSYLIKTREALLDYRQD